MASRAGDRTAGDHRRLQHGSGDRHASSSSDAQPATAAWRMLLDDVGNFIRDFGRWPKPNDTHIKEDLLAKRLARGKEEFDEAHLTELQGLPATAAWARVRSFGRFPRRIAMPQTKAEREEGKLWHLLYLQKRVGIPDEVWKDLHLLCRSGSCMHMCLSGFRKRGDACRQNSCVVISSRCLLYLHPLRCLRP